MFMQRSAKTTRKRSILWFYKNEGNMTFVLNISEYFENILKLK